MLDHPILTPENVEFRYTLAAVGTRAQAWLIDLCVMAAIELLLGLILSVGVVALPSLGVAAWIALTFGVGVGYPLGLELLGGGQTVGKRLMGLRVVDVLGMPPRPTQVVLRNLLRAVDLLPALGALGALAIALHPQHRRLGDLAAGTVVIRERRVPPPEELRRPTSRAERRRGAPPITLPADVARRIRPDEREFLLDLALRRDTLPDGARLRLFGSVAASLRDRLELRQDPSVSDERLTVEITAALFSGR